MKGVCVYTMDFVSGHKEINKIIKWKAFTFEPHTEDFSRV